MPRSDGGRVRVGVIGCGLIAQVMHLPHLRELASLFEIAAVCDLSPSLAEQVASDYHVDGAYTDWRALVEDADLDAVLVLSNSSAHADQVVGALDAGLHVLVEKPLCVTLREADAIVAAAERADRVAAVAYMRRFDASLDVVRSSLGSATPEGSVSLVHVVTHEGPLDRFVAGRRLRTPGGEPGVTAPAGRTREELAREAIGTDDPLSIRYYLATLLESAVHELGFIAPIAGRPQAVTSAVAWSGGMSTHVAGSLPGATPFAYTFVTFDQLSTFQQHIDFYAADRVVQVRMPSPFRRDRSGEVSVRESRGGHEITHTTHLPDVDGFAGELIAFHRSVVGGGAAGGVDLVTVAEAREDVRTCIAIARAQVTGERQEIVRTSG
jgi:predicted dehydrogenase